MPISCNIFWMLYEKGRVGNMGKFILRSKDQIFMEYCIAGSIDEILRKVKRPFEEIQISAIIESVLRSLKYLHKIGRVHRDIKPGAYLIVISYIRKYFA